VFFTQNTTRRVFSFFPSRFQSSLVARGEKLIVKSKNTKASGTTASAIDLSLSTQRGKKVAINCCEPFAKKLGYPSIRDIPQSLVQRLSFLISANSFLV
jgi:hypothetical protein